MVDSSVSAFGIEIPSGDPIFLAVVLTVHIPLGLACVIVGAAAMLSEKRRGRHSRFGSIYFWCLSGLFVSAAFLAIVRWAEDYHLLVLGTVAFASGLSGRVAVRQRWRRRFELHVVGMGLSYLLMLVAFYVDNGKQLPLWRGLPTVLYWLLPLVVGVPIIIATLVHHPLLRQARSR